LVGCSINNLKKEPTNLIQTLEITNLLQSFIKVDKIDIGLMGCYFDYEKRKQKYSDLRTYTSNVKDSYDTVQL
jgi:hypothetical protein